MRKVLLITGIACISISVLGLLFYRDKPNSEASVQYPALPPTRIEKPIPAPTPKPTPKSMTVALTEDLYQGGVWRVFIPEGDKWFDTKIPVVARLSVTITSENKTQWLVKVAEKEFPSNYGGVSNLNLCLNDSTQPAIDAGLRDTIKIKLEPGREDTFRVAIYFVGGECEQHPLSVPAEHMEIHRQAFAWWDEARKRVGRRV